jgi:hypothetical protein
VWSLLRRNQEPLLAGTAVALVILAVLTHSHSISETPRGAQSLSPAEVASGGQAALLDVPRDHDYYRAKWRQIATDFYAAHPVADAEPGSLRTDDAVVTASLSDQSALTDNSASTTANASQSAVKPVSHVTHSASHLVADVKQAASHPVIVSRNVLPGNMIVASAVICGLLAFFSFRMLWPTVEDSDHRSIRTLVAPPTIDQSSGGAPIRETSVMLRIELPANWVCVRPRLRQRLKPTVLSVCYVASGVAAWTIFS